MNHAAAHRLHHLDASDGHVEIFVLHPLVQPVGNGLSGIKAGQYCLYV